MSGLGGALATGAAMGVGSEVYSPVSHGRKAIGIELKESYYKQATINVKEAEKRFIAKKAQLSMF